MKEALVRCTLKDTDITPDCKGILQPNCVVQCSFIEFVVVRQDKQVEIKDKEVKSLSIGIDDTLEFR